MISIYAKLAHAAAEHYAKTRQILPLPYPLAPQLSRQKACYIYVLEKPGDRLKDISGQILPRAHTLAEEIIWHTINALNMRPSFNRADLPHLKLAVAVLDPLQRISDPIQLDPQKFGLYLKTDTGKSAVILPHRPGINSAEDQLATGLREGGINQRRDFPVMYRFGVNFHP